MKKKQIIGLLIAGLLFAVIGVISVFVNTAAESIIGDAAEEILAGGSNFDPPDDDYIAVVKVQGTIQEQAVKTSHPGRQQWDFFQIILRNKAGQIRTSAVSRHHIKIASVISHIENRFALRYVLFSDNSQMRTGFPENQFEYSLYDAQGGNISCTGIEFSDNPFNDQHRNDPCQNDQESNLKPETP